MTAFGAIGLLIGITNLSLSFLVYTDNRKKQINRLWAIFTLSVSTWGFSAYAITIAPDPQSALIIWRLAVAGVILIPITFFKFTYAFLGKKNVFGTAFVLIIGSVLIILDSTPYFLYRVEYVFNSFYWDTPSLFFNLYVIFFTCTITWVLFVAYRFYLKTTDKIRKRQLFFFILASLIGFVGGSTSFLPTYKIYIYPYFNATIIIFSILITYSIVRHHLFHIKLITAQLVTFGLWVFILIRLLFAESLREFTLEGVLLLITFVFGLVLIKSVLNEINQRKRIEILANDLRNLNLHLSEKVAEQTAEVRHAYDLEKHARRELEKLNETKDQFIMITQHHLRTPVTSIEWELESILAGTYGPITPDVQQALTDSQEAVARLTHIIDDFLNITALKTGQNILNISQTRLLPAIESIVRELKSDIGRRKISIHYPTDPSSWPELPIDAPKMHDILLIVLENAIKYNRDSGSVVLSTQVRDTIFELSIENTGIGITPDELGKIGSALFYRGTRARTVNTVGMGVGLSVTKAIIKAHRGTFSIDSKGENMGAIVKISLPLKRG